MRRRGELDSDLLTVDVFWVDDTGALLDSAGTPAQPDPAWIPIEPAPDQAVDRERAASRGTLGSAHAHVGPVGRRHGRDEVRAALLADPRTVAAVATGGGLSRWLTPWMRFDPSSFEVESRWAMAWPVRVGLLPGRFGRLATLRIYPSDSMNVTIVQLLPKHGRRLPASTFVYLGVRWIRRVARAIERRDA